MLCDIGVVEALVPSALYVHSAFDTNAATTFSDYSTSASVRHGSRKNRNNQERSLHCDGRSGIDRRGWKQIRCRKTNGTLSLRRIDRETVLRWHTLENRFQSGGESGAGIKGIIFVIPGEVENGAVGEAAT